MKGLFLQPDGFPHHWRSPAGSWVPATTGTNNLLATAQNSCFNNGGFEQGPFRIHVPSLPWNTGEVLSEVGVEDHLDRFFRQMFPADPHNSFGSSWSVRPNSPPGGDQLTALPLSLPECPRHTVVGLMIRL
ncbi:hypothetical protein LDENG_00079050 [Lucifuga dentata]|nr:hypothetical protein LDENG_00079050 [Lucifuga dentata]